MPEDKKHVKTNEESFDIANSEEAKTELPVESAHADLNETTMNAMDGTFIALEEQLRQLEKTERAIDSAYSTGKANRAQITHMAQLDAAEAVAMAGIAMESDIDADEAMKIAIIAEKSGNREKAKNARKKEREARRRAKTDHKTATSSAKRAYDAIRFSDPNSMGLMRAVQILFAIHIGITLVWLMLTSRDAFATTYSVNTAIDWLVLIAEGCGFWLLLNRYKIARPFICGLCVFALIVPAIIDISSGRFNLFAILFNGLFYLAVLIYFLFSSRVKATLVNEIGKDKGEYEKDNFVINRRGWPFIRNLIMYFIIFSIVGHFMEMGMCQFIIMGLVQGEYDPSNTMLWRDWLYPFPMEGAAVVVIALVLYPFFEWLKKKFTGKKRFLAYVISFFAGALLCTIIEGGMGLIVNADLQLWDYRENFCNIGGQVCLQNTMAFGVVAAIITWWAYPAMERWIARVPNSIMNVIATCVFVFGAIVWSLYLINPPGVDEANKATTPEEKKAIIMKEQTDKMLQERTSLSNGIDAFSLGEKEMRESIQNSEALSDEEKTRIITEFDKICMSLENINTEIKDTSNAPMAVTPSER